MFCRPFGDLKNAPSKWSYLDINNITNKHFPEYTCKSVHWYQMIVEKHAVLSRKITTDLHKPQHFHSQNWNITRPLKNVTGHACIHLSISWSSSISVWLIHAFILYLSHICLILFHTLSATYLSMPTFYFSLTCCSHRHYVSVFLEVPPNILLNVINHTNHVSFLFIVHVSIKFLYNSLLMHKVHRWQCVLGYR